MVDEGALRTLFSWCRPFGRAPNRWLNSRPISKRPRHGSFVHPVQKITKSLVDKPNLIDGTSERSERRPTFCRWSVREEGGPAVAKPPLSHPTSWDRDQRFAF